MTEKDREITEKLLKEALKQQSELIHMQFENLWSKLDSIHDEVKRTNGTVREHTKLIHDLQNLEVRHVLNCPQKKEIESISEQVNNIEKMEVGRNAVSKFTWKQIGAIGIIAGLVLSILTLILK